MWCANHNDSNAVPPNDSTNPTTGGNPTACSNHCYTTEYNCVR